METPKPTICTTYCCADAFTGVTTINCLLRRWKTPENHYRCALSGYACEPENNHLPLDCPARGAGVLIRWAFRPATSAKGKR